MIHKDIIDSSRLYSYLNYMITNFNKMFLIDKKNKIF